MDTILQKLAGGDRRSIGRVDEVVTEVIKKPVLFEELIGGLFVEDPVVRMRAADAIEKITLSHAQYLKPHKQKILQLAAVATQQELRWHLAQIAPRLDLTPKEKIKVVNILFDYLQDKSNIVVTFSLQALADFAVDDRKLRPRVMGVLKELTKSGSPAVRNRGKKLLQKLKKVTKVN